jgi:uncharacterized protein (TIGR02391 family)
VSYEFEDFMEYVDITSQRELQRYQNDMQEGQQYLTRGLITGFRNPVNHSPMATVVPSVISELDCLNMLSLISYLATRLDSATVNEGAAKRDCEPAKQ